jgi:hypothetical protein
MAAYGIPDNPSLETNWRLRAWWLHSVWGYRVLKVKRHPRSGWFGRLAYDESFLMLPRDETKH